VSFGKRTDVGQPIFEPFKDQLRPPAEVLRRFFEPLIREASERQSKREAGADREDGRHFRLIDRLLSTISGMACYRCDR
jgi:hypothetical protein